MVSSSATLTTCPVEVVEDWAVAAKSSNKSRKIEKNLIVVPTKFALKMIVIYNRLSTVTKKPILIMDNYLIMI